MSSILEQDQTEAPTDPSRRRFLGRTSLTLAAAIGGAAVAHAQQRSQIHAGEADHSSSNPGQENAALLAENPNSNTPPETDFGDIGPIWYSFDLARKRVEEGGWTHQVTQRELPPSKDIAGVNMRLTAGSFRELHWHTADEWAYMLYGNARVTVLNPDGTIFIDDVSQGDLWFFPAGYPHSIQGLGPDGCEFLLVFDEGGFSEDGTFLVSEWLAHTPDEVITKNSNLDAAAIAKLPKRELYIFPSDLPDTLAADRAEVGGSSVASKQQYTFKMRSMEPTRADSGGEVRVVDSHNFPVSKSIAAGLVILKPGAIRELHWHPNASEWQFYLAGKGRMTVFMPPGRARTMDFNANDVGYVPAVAGHYIENTGTEDLIFLELFKADTFQDFSLNNWLRRLPTQMVTAHTNLTAEEIRRIPTEKQEIIGR
ncbi:cupin domain-containing protein [Granulicella sp. 5B5]|uniref:cupin domain-containing protein n=1 Tax=Granulicella sp. 5B5 TaxID=1617967 RepID=UPI0015F67D4E|nr:cupin domain-containing protein [Granulicella sp. 5B5]QMV19004.1 cupin domain-containing protein [Granulicella sp. 5B5]